MREGKRQMAKAHRSERAVPTTRERLTSAGLNSTEVRVQILDEVSKAHAVVTPDTVFQALGAEVCSRISVYRALAELHQAGLLYRYRLGNGGVAYAPHDDRLRAIVTCTHCGSTEIIEDPQLGKGLRDTVLRLGFLLDPSPVYLNGTCPRCQTRRRTVRRGRRFQPGEP